MSDEAKQLNKARQALVDRVLSRLDAGAIPWDNGMKGIATPYNAITGKPYRGMNVFSLMLAGILTGKEDPRWLTFNQATDAGYKVKKGAKGVPIELYKTIDKRTKKDADLAAIKEEIKDMTSAEQQAFKKANLQTFARTYYVFNASDVAGIESYRAPILTPADISARNERIEIALNHVAAPIVYDGNGRNYYSPSTDTIHLTKREAFKTDDQFYLTGLHEKGHSTGHSSRLNRPFGTFGTKAYAKEELRAEIASLFSGTAFGLDLSDRIIENSAEYVRSWAQLIRDDPQTLIDATFEASRAADYIIDAVQQFEIEKRQFLQAWEATPEIERRAVKDELLHMERMGFTNDDTHGRERLAWVREYEIEKEKTQKEKAQQSKQPPTTSPQFKTNLDNIPDAMKALPNWVAFRTETLENGKVKKILLSPNKGASSVEYLKWAKADDPTTWTTFDKAAAFAKKYNLNGLAFAMSGSGMTCIDLDHHLDEHGKPSVLAQKFIDAAQGTYIEKSVSGRGLHIFYVGARPSGHQNRNITLDLETYDSARFMSMTGNLYGNAQKEVASPSSELTNLLKSNLNKLQQYSAPGTPLGMSDNALIEKIRASKRGYEFDALWRGEDVAGDHSVSDFKLCNMLAFFSGGDAAQVERCFRASGLYRPEKGDAYVRRTAEKACTTLSKQIDPRAYAPKSEAKNTKKNNSGKPSGGGNGGRGSSGR